MAEPLRPDGDVFVEDVVIRTPGLSGIVEVYRPTSPGMRGEELTTEEFHEALGDAGLAEQLSVVISQHQEITPAEGTRGSGAADDIEVNVPAPGDGNGQVLLYAAEDGSLSWHFAVDVPPTAAPDRGGERRTYRVPKAVVPPDEQDADAHRGIVGAIGKKVLKVLVFPLIDPVLGKVGDHFASKWEAKNRLNRVRWMTVDGFRSSQADSFTDADWALLGAGRALLLVHGTFSTAHGGFGHLPRETMAELHRRYDGRVAAFDHHSISVSPKENADLLAGLVPDGTRRRGRRGDPLAGRPGRSRDRGGGRARRRRAGDGRLTERRHRAGRPTPPLRPAGPVHRPGAVRAGQRRHRHARTDLRGGQAGRGRRRRRPRRAHVDGPERRLPRRAQRPTGPGGRAPGGRRRLRAARRAPRWPGSLATAPPTWSSPPPTTTSSYRPSVATTSPAATASRSTSSWCSRRPAPSTTTRSSASRSSPSGCSTGCRPEPSAGRRRPLEPVETLAPIEVSTSSTGGGAQPE